MKKSAKRLDRRSFWMWAVPLGLGHLVVYIAIVRGAGQLWWLDVILLMLLAIALVRRFRDIGWPGWIGPTILLVTVIGLPHQFFDPVASFVLRYAIANHVGPQAMQLLLLYGPISGLANLVLLIVAGRVPGRPALTEVAYVFE